MGWGGGIQIYPMNVGTMFSSHHLVEIWISSLGVHWKVGGSCMSGLGVEVGGEGGDKDMTRM